MNDTKLFPIQSEGVYPDHPNYRERTYIPWWLAEEAYQYYEERFGNAQSLDKIAARGGFGRGELLMLLRKSLDDGKPNQSSTNSS